MLPCALVSKHTSLLIHEDWFLTKEILKYGLVWLLFAFKAKIIVILDLASREEGDDSHDYVTNRVSK
jgi:hypothetical protein